VYFPTPFGLFSKMFKSCKQPTKSIITLRDYSNFTEVLHKGAKIGTSKSVKFFVVQIYYYKIDQISYFLVGKWNEVPMHQKMWNLNIVCKSYEGSKFFSNRCSKSVSLTKGTYWFTKGVQSEDLFRYNVVLSVPCLIFRLIDNLWSYGIKIEIEFF